MIAAMPRPRPPFLHRETTRHGRTVWFVRLGKGPRFRVRGDYGSPDFTASYRDALAQARGEEPSAPVQTAPQRRAGTLAWLIARYRDSAPWASFSPATKRQRENILKQVIDAAGAYPISSVKKSTIIAARDRRRETPAQANHVLKTLRGLFKWAADAGLAREDPTSGVAFCALKTAGHHTWTAEEIARFEARWPIGTRQRLAMAILLYTGLRRGDAVRLGCQHVRDGWIVLTMEKTGERLQIPLAPALAGIIAASPTGDLAFLATETGRPMVKAGFGNWFRQACNVAGVRGTAHGLRKALATTAAERGATERELAALLGHSGVSTVAAYTRAARQRVLAKEAMDKALGADDPRTSYSRIARQGAGRKSKMKGTSNT